MFRTRARPAPRARIAGLLAVVCSSGLALGAIGLVAAPASATVRAATAVTVKPAKVPGVGTVLVDPQGKTLYTHTNGSAAAGCDSSCVPIWPPLEVAAGAKVKAAKGVKGVAVGPDGTSVTVKSLPLYTFLGDSKPGQANGNGLNSFGGDWKVVKVSSKSAKS